MLLITATILLFAGCSRRERQFEAEGQIINEIFRLLPIYETENPGVRITNLAQVFTNHTREAASYPHQWHWRLAAFKEFAGFTNSVYERYIFFPAGITNQRITGELLFMHATPYPGSNGEMQRKMVAQDADGFHSRTLAEKNVQAMFHELGITQPKSIPMPPPPPAPPELEYKRPLLSATRNAVTNFFEQAGMSVTAAHWMWVSLLSLPLVLLMAIAFFFWKHKSH